LNIIIIHSLSLQIRCHFSFSIGRILKIEKFALKKFVIHVREKNKKKSKTVCMSSLFLCNQQAKNEVPLLTEYIPALI